MVTNKWIAGIDDITIPKKIREAVFIKEQGFNINDEYDENDVISWHVVLYWDDVPCATGRMYVKNSVYHIGRIAVLKQYRRRHLADLLMRLLLRRGLDMGAKKFAMTSQIYITHFYEKFGFKKVSENIVKTGKEPHYELFATDQDIVFFTQCKGC